MISDSCWFVFCFAYSVENRYQTNRFIVFESSVHGRPPRLGWTDSGRVLLCNPDRPHSNTSTKQIFDNSIIIVDEGPRVDTDLLFLPFGWLTVWEESYYRTDVSFNFSLPWASWAYYFQETWIISCIFITESWFYYIIQENNSYFMETFIKILL